MAKITLAKAKPRVKIPAKIGGTSLVPLSPRNQGYLAGRSSVPPPVAAPNPWDRFVQMQMGAISTPAQIAAQASKTAIAQEKAVLAAQKAQSGIEVGRLNDQSYRAEGFARALAKLQSGADNEARNDYLAASNTIQGLGTGLTGAVAAEQESAAARASEAVAKMTGGLGVTSGPDVAAMRNAAQYAGVTVPATSFAESAANAAGLARSHAAERTGEIASIARDYRAQADQAIRESGMTARAEIAKRPTTINELVAQLTQNRQTGITNLAGILGQRTTFAQNQAKLKDDAAQRAIENARATRQLDITQRYLDNSTRTTGAALSGVDPETGLPTIDTQKAAVKSAADWSAINGYKSDAKGNPVGGKIVPIKGYHVNKAGTGVVADVKPGKGAKGLSPSGMSSLVKDTQATIREGLKTSAAGQLYEPDAPDDQQLTDAEGNPTGFIADPNKPGQSAVRYADALAAAIEGGPSTAQWRAKAKRLVNAAYPEGANGRPYSRANARKAALKGITAAYNAGTNYNDALTLGRESGVYPIDILKSVMRKVYYGPARSPINGIPPTSPDYPGYREDD